MTQGSLGAQPVVPPLSGAQPPALPDCQTQPATLPRQEASQRPTLSQGRACGSNLPGSLDSDPAQPQSTVSSPNAPTIAGYSEGLAQ